MEQRKDILFRDQLIETLEKITNNKKKIPILYNIGLGFLVYVTQ